MFLKPLHIPKIVHVIDIDKETEEYEKLLQPDPAEVPDTERLITRKKNAHKGDKGISKLKIQLQLLNELKDAHPELTLILDAEYARRSQKAVKAIKKIR